MYGEMGVYIQVFLTLALVGGEWLASRLNRLTPRGNSTRYPLEWRLGGPQDRSGWREEKAILDFMGTWTPILWPSSPQSVAIPTKLSQFLEIAIYYTKFNTKKFEFCTQNVNFTSANLVLLFLNEVFQGSDLGPEPEYCSEVFPYLSSTYPHKYLDINLNWGATAFVPFGPIFLRLTLSAS
jgi:hypothetical protein